MATIVAGDFEWDEAKANSNAEKHGVSFEEAATAVIDANAVFLTDGSSTEDRFRVIGMSVRLRILLVVTVDRGDRDRIISARPATLAEENIYGQD